MKTNNKHPQWVLDHKKPGTEVKCISGRFYLYGVKSVYDKISKKSKKVSLGILGSITENNGFVPSKINDLKMKSEKTFYNKEIICLEYGFSKWLLDTMEQEGILDNLKHFFPDLWKFIVLMVYCRTGYKSPLKNIAFYTEQSDILNIIDWKGELYDKKISDYLFDLGTKQDSIHQYMQPKEPKKRTVLMDATDITLQSKNVALSQKGYNSKMNFQPQFVLLYLYDAQSLRPLYYRIMPGNIRDVSMLKNTLKISGIQNSIYIADKGFYSESNIKELEENKLEYIIPLKRDNKLIPYHSLENIEQTDNYFQFAKKFIFFAPTIENNERKINLFVDGFLKENEKIDYLRRIITAPENFTSSKFKEKVKTMGTLSIIHNTNLAPKEVYTEYKHRCEVEQFFDHYKNTIDASTTYMQREESLNGLMFINHISMELIYKIYEKLKSTPLNKTQKLNHKYSITDTIEHLKSVKKIKFEKNDNSQYTIAEINKLTKTLLEKLKISIT